MSKFNDRFARISRKVTDWLGSPTALMTNLVILLVWIISGFILGFSNTHQLLINTFTTIYTWLVSGALLYTQNRDSKAIHFKLNELILNDRNARNKLLAIEEDTEDAIKEIGKEFKEIKKSSDDL